MNIEEMRKSLEELMATMKEVSVSMEGKSGEELEALKVKHTASYDEAKSIQLDLDSAISAKQKEAEMEKSLETAKSFSKAVLPKVPAQAIDVSQKYRDHETLFRKFIGSGEKMMSGNEMKELEPSTNSSFQAGAGGASMPLSLKIKMLGVPWALKVGVSKDKIDACLKATMVSSTPSLGGYTVPEDFRLPVLDLPIEQAHILDRATVVPTTTGEVTMPKSAQEDGDEFGGMVGAWISEAGEKPATDTTFEQVKIPAYEYAMHTQISHRLLSRSPVAMEQWIANKGRQVCLDALDTAFISGNGSGKPLGILNTTGIREVTRETGGEVCQKDLVEKQAM